MKIASMRIGDVTSADGVKLAVYEAGNPAGPEILFIHGTSQCSLCWQKQIDDPALAGDFRLTAFDIRGHGASDKPTDRARYAENHIFAEDVRAVMAALDLKGPVLVAWSYAGRLVSDYVSAFGTGNISGINYVCARTKTDAQFNGPGTAHLVGMQDKDLARNIAASHAFLSACFAAPPPRAEFETALAYNMMVPPEVRAAHMARPPSDGAILSRLDVPVLVTQGSEDQLVSRGLGEFTAQTVPGAILSIYDGIGHAPFAEDAPRFNRELAAFVRSATGSSGKADTT